MNTSAEIGGDYQASQRLIRSLQRKDAFPHAVQDIQVLETHISWIVLTGKYAYKIKKPLDLGFLNFSTIELRKHFCEEELRLNRRFSPDLYIDVVPIGGTPQQRQVGEEPAMDWAVRMHQFPPEAGLDAELAQRRASVADLRQLAEVLAGVHRAAPVISDERFGSLDSIRVPAMDNFDSLRSDCDSPLLQAQLVSLCEWTELRCRQLAPIFAERARGGFIRECHGDLHAGNIVRLEAGLVPFDCIEFSADLRCIDVMSDVAFLCMDLIYRQRPDLAVAFLNRYLECSGDYAGLAVLPFYLVYRAVVRAKIAAVRYQQHGSPADSASTADHLALAARLSDPGNRPLLVICHGLSGSGKTWLSEQLIPAIPAIRLRSDIIRKQMAGLDEASRSESGIGEGLYTADRTTHTYARLAKLAKLALAAGLNVIVDATCLRRADRDTFLAVAGAMNSGAVILDCQAPVEELERRIQRRYREGTDASEADLAVLAYQLANVEPLNAEELARCIPVDTAENPIPAAITQEILERTTLGPG